MAHREACEARVIRAWARLLRDGTDVVINEIHGEVERGRSSAHLKFLTACRV